MNRKLSVLASAIALTTLACTANPQSASTPGQLSSSASSPEAVDEEQAASPSESSPVGAVTSSPSELIEMLGDRCDLPLEVDYRSQTLISPDGNIRVQAQGTLRKSADSDSDDSDSSNCLGSQHQTLNRQITLDKPEGIERMVKDDYDQGYVVFQPLSFSADSSYLISEVTVAYSGGDAAVYTSIIDVAANEELSGVAPCKSEDIDDTPIQNLLGFTDNAEVVFECLYNAGPEFIEAMNLDTGEARQLPERPVDLSKYGTVENEFEVDPTRTFE